jgi:hypothetical protein
MLFGNCLGVLDSSEGMDFVEQHYQTLQSINNPQKCMQLLLETLEILRLLHIPLI